MALTEQNNSLHFKLSHENKRLFMQKSFLLCRIVNTMDTKHSKPIETRLKEIFQKINFSFVSTTTLFYHV